MDREFVRSWNEITDTFSPMSRMAHVSVALGRYIYLINGYTVLQSSPELVRQVIAFDRGRLARYDTLTGQISTIYCEVDEQSCTAMSYPPECLYLSGSCAALVGRCVYIFGGFCLERNMTVNGLTRVWFRGDEAGKSQAPLWQVITGTLDPLSLRSQGHKPQPSPRDKGSMVNWRDKLIVFGGYGVDFRPPNRYLRGNGWGYLYDAGEWEENEPTRGWTNQVLVYDITLAEWTNPKQRGRVPEPRAAHRACVVADRMLVFGGRSSSRGANYIRRLNDLYELDLDTWEWTQIELGGTLPCGRSWMTLTPISNRYLLLVGGLSSTNMTLADAHVIDLETRTVIPDVKPAASGPDVVAGDVDNDEELPPAPSPPRPLARLWHSASVGIDGRVYVLGGCSSNLYHDLTLTQDRVECYHVIEPSTLYRQCLRTIVHHGLCDSDLPDRLLSDLSWSRGA